MITSKLQYRTTFKALCAFVEVLQQTIRLPPSGSPELRQAYIDGMWSQVDDLLKELEDYRNLLDEPSRKAQL